MRICILLAMLMLCFVACADEPQTIEVPVPVPEKVEEIAE